MKEHRHTSEEHRVAPPWNGQQQGTAGVFKPFKGVPKLNSYPHHVPINKTV
jgi:hypothetical protein